MTKIENPPKQLDVIAVGAHPDDCEIGCGGTLAVLAQQGLSVGIIDLTDGEPTPGCDDPQIRHQTRSRTLYQNELLTYFEQHDKNRKSSKTTRRHRRWGSS